MTRSTISLSYTIVIVLQTIATSTNMAKPVCGPPTHYVVKGDDTSLKCRNYSNGESRGFISNALWYRTYSNGTSHLIRRTGQVTAFSYTLIIYKMREADQGNYSCCTPKKDCCKPTFVAIAEPADVQVASSSYVTSVGSSITLACKIISKGTPTASFQWIRQRDTLSDEMIRTNDTHTTLTLNNVTEKDGGPYTCAAIGKFDKLSIQKTIQLQVHPNIIIYGPTQAVIGTNVSINCSIATEGDLTPDIHITTPLGETINSSKIFFTALPNNTGNYTCNAIASKTVLKAWHHLLVVNDSMTSMHKFPLHFLITFYDGDCFLKESGNFQSQLTFDLEQYINGLQDFFISAVPIYFECINASKALYSVQIRGNIGHEQLRNFHIEIRDVTLLVCNSICETSLMTGQHTDSKNNNHTSSDDSASSSMTAMTISVVAIVISGLICVIVVSLLVCVRYRSNKQTDVKKHHTTIYKEAVTSTESQTVPPSDAKTSANTAINKPALVKESVNNLITVKYPVWIVPSEIINIDDIS